MRTNGHAARRDQAGRTDLHDRDGAHGAARRVRLRAAAAGVAGVLAAGGLTVTATPAAAGWHDGKAGGSAVGDAATRVLGAVQGTPPTTPPTPPPPPLPTPYPRQYAMWSVGDEFRGTPWPASPGTCKQSVPGSSHAWGTKAVQAMLNGQRELLLRDPVKGAWITADPARWPVLEVTGNYCGLSTRAMRAFQYLMKLPGSGTMGYRTSIALIAPWVASESAAAGVDPHLVTCLIHHESNRDPSAVGPNGLDLGLGQISLPANPTVTEAQVWDPFFSIRYVAQRLGAAFRQYSNPDAAILSYNSPRDAAVLQATGVPPSEHARHYVADIREC